MRHRGRHNLAYTLIEMLIALVMFAVITVATGFILTGAIRAREATQARVDEATEMRSLFGTLGRDLRATFVVANGANSYFVAPGNGSGTILTFTTMASRIALDPATDAAGPTAATGAARPQSDVWLVSYVFNPETGVLDRCVTRVPNPDTIPQEQVLVTEVARNLRSIEVVFPDPVNGDRSDWNYMVDTSTTATGSGSGSTGATSSVTQTTDTTLPTSVQITVVRDSKTGSPVSQTFTVALMNSTPQPAGQKPATTTTTGTSGTGAGS